MLKLLSKVIGRNVTDSPIEEILYNKLLEYGLKAEPQHNVGYFFIDLAFPEIKLAIEADGKAYHSSKEQRERDAYRQKRLTKLGWMFERFTGRFIHRHGDAAAAKIALRYFEKKLTKEQKALATGRIVAYFSQYDSEFALSLTNSFLKEL